MNMFLSSCFQFALDSIRPSSTSSSSSNQFGRKSSNDPSGYLHYYIPELIDQAEEDQKKVSLIEAQNWKEKGNLSFKTGNYSNALTEYSKGLSFFKVVKTKPDYGEYGLMESDGHFAFPGSNQRATTTRTTTEVIVTERTPSVNPSTHHPFADHVDTQDPAYANHSANENVHHDHCDNTTNHRPNLNEVVLLSNLLSNRSASFFNEKMYQEALHDAEQVTLLRPQWAKGHFRKAETLVKLREFHEAFQSYEIASNQDPSNILIKARMMKCKYAKMDFDRGFVIHQLLPGRHLCQKSWFAPIQNIIFDFAVQMRNFIYIIENTSSHECIVVDACWDIDGIIEYIKNQKLILVGAAITHYHVDHCGGKPPPPYDKYPVRVDGIVKLLKKVANIPVYVHEDDIPGLMNTNPDMPKERIKIVKDGDSICLPLLADRDPAQKTLTEKLKRVLSTSSSLLASASSSKLSSSSTSTTSLSNLTSRASTMEEPLTQYEFLKESGVTTRIQFIHTPGHTPGSQCLLINRDRLLSGDTLFIGSCGRLDFPDSDESKMNISLGEKLSRLPDSVVVFPGHDYGGEFTTIGREREFGLLNQCLKENH